MKRIETGNRTSMPIKDQPSSRIMKKSLVERKSKKGIQSLEHENIFPRNQEAKERVIPPRFTGTQFGSRNEIDQGQSPQTHTFYSHLGRMGQTPQQGSSVS